MEYVDLQEEIARMEDEGDLRRLSMLTELLRAFPDLRAVRDHWQVLRYCSPSANTEVDSLEVLKGFEGDRRLEAWLYIVIDKAGTKLYADPPCFIVADTVDPGFGQAPRPGWRELLESWGLSRSAILLVKDYLDRHPPIQYPE